MTQHRRGVGSGLHSVNQLTTAQRLVAKHVPPLDGKRTPEIVAAILVLFGVSVLSAAGGSAHVIHLYKALWGVSMLWMVRFRWRARLPLRGPLFLIVITTVLRVVALRIMTQLEPFTGRSIDTTSVGPVWLFTAAALAIPAALGHEVFFRGACSLRLSCRVHFRDSP